MCFIKTDNRIFAQKAKEPITCYKVVVKGDYDNQFFSEIWRFEYLLMRNYETKLESPFYLGGIRKNFYSGFHSYIDLEEAIKFCNKMNIVKNYAVVLKCIIPKGEKYRKNDINYLSNKIFVECVL